MQAGDVDAADLVMRRAFGSYLGLPNPEDFLGDASFVRPRFAAAPDNAFAAEQKGCVVGSNIASRWGSFGFFGPLSVAPELWERSLARRLMEPVLERFEQWGLAQAGLFTFPNSPKHLALYGRYGFRPRYLTTVVARPLAPTSTNAASTVSGAERPADAAGQAVGAAARLTDSIWSGLDVGEEIEAIARLGLGETWLAEDDEGLAALACCHLGAGTEAGSTTAYVKFAALRSGAGAARRLHALLDACSTWAAANGASQLVAGVNTARTECADALAQAGFRTMLLGVAMQRDGGDGFCRTDAWVLDDWR
jgi:GNAT superfamily N-acetyltransferase